jgi:N-acetylglucosaminyldiphosphoundecaprenol N-acetyl-beta-D-mannosaminyltransferase
LIPTREIDGVPMQSMTFDAAVETIVGWAEDRSGGYICTPNVDHIVRARRDPAFRAAVLGARLRVPDGMGIVYGSWLARRSLRGTVTGRLLPEAVGRKLRERGLSVGLVGGGPGVARAAATALESRDVLMSAAIGPSMGLVLGSTEDDEIVAQLRSSGARVVFVGLGAPKQELWMAAHSPDLPKTVLVGIGAALDVLAGRFPVAPRWMTRLGLEWLYRLGHEPRRLARRYLWDDPRFFAWMVGAGLRPRGSSGPRDR